MTASAEITQRLNHVLRFTQTEVTAFVYALRGWFANQAVAIGALEAGDDAWMQIVMLEHYDSTLDENPANRTAEQITVYNQMVADATAAKTKVNAILQAASLEDTRVNNNAATYITNLLASL